MRRTICNKAMKCIDEACPGDNALNVLNFPVADFLDEAARRIVRMAPLHTLGNGRDFSHAAITDRGDGSGRVSLPADFVRLLLFRMEGWQRPASEPIRPADPRYKKQFYHAVRGGCAKPVVALIDGDAVLEYFSIPAGKPHTIAQARYFGLSSVDCSYPSVLIEPTAWMLAHLVLSVMNDTPGSEIARAKTNEYLALL